MVMRWWDRLLLATLVVITLALGYDFYQFTSSSHLSFSTGEKLSQNIEQVTDLETRLEQLNIKESFISGENSRVISELHKEMKKGSYSAVSPATLSRVEAVLSNKSRGVKNQSTVIEDVKESLGDMFAILAERRYRQRHVVKTLQLQFQSISQRSISQNDYSLIASFLPMLAEFETILNESAVRDDYKERVNDVIQQTRRSILSGGNQEQIQKVASDLSFLKNVLFLEKSVSLNKVLTYQKKSQELFSELSSRSVIYLAYLAFSAFVLFGTVMKNRLQNFSIAMSMRHRFRKKMKYMAKIQQKNHLLKQTRLGAMAMVTKSGRIVWSTKGFKDYFYSKSERKKGWTHLKSTSLISLAQETQVPNSYRLLNDQNVELIVQEDSSMLTSGVRLVSLSPIQSYFREFQQKKISYGDFRFQAVENNYCMVESVIEDILSESELYGLNVNLEYAGKLPRFFYDSPQAIQESLGRLLKTLNQTTDILNLQSTTLGIDYQKEQKNLTISLRIYGRSISDKVLHHSLKKGSLYLNLSDCLEDCEFSMKNNNGEILVSNITQPGNHFILIEFKYTESEKTKLERVTHSTTPERKIRAKRKYEDLVM